MGAKLCTNMQMTQDSNHLNQLYQPNKDSHVVPYDMPKAPEDWIQHYLPPNFPIDPILTPDYVQLCNSTWKSVLSGDTDRMRQYYGQSGISLFTDELFQRLYQRDDSIECIFRSDVMQKTLVIRATAFMLKMSTTNTDEIISRCSYLGHRHKMFANVRPYHFAEFSNGLLEVMMYWLGDAATLNIAEAWSNVCAFYLRHILAAYLQGMTDPFEYHQNVKYSIIKELKTAD